MLGSKKRNLLLPSSLARGNGDTDAHASHDLVTLDVTWFAQSANDTVSQSARFLRSGNGELQHRKFIAAETGDDVALAYA